jgi:predicted dehydrogenase
VVLTAPPVRGVPAVAAAKSGRHVFTEGPMAKSVKEADEILAAVEAAGVKHNSQCGGRFTRGMEHARRAVASGLLGPLAKASASVTWYHPASYWGRSWPGRFETDGGGAVLHHCRYVLDPFLSIANWPIVEVTAYAGPFLRDIEVDSYSVALVRFANGAVGTVEASLLHHEHPETPFNGGRLEFLGENASMVVIHTHPSPNAPSLLVNIRESMTRSKVSFGSSNTPGVVAKLEALADDLGDIPETPSQLDQSRLWVRSILEDKPPPVPISVPRAHVELSRAIYKSQQTGARVTLPLDRDDPYYTFEGRLTRPAWMPGPPAG